MKLCQETEMEILMAVPGEFAEYEWENTMAAVGVESSVDFVTATKIDRENESVNSADVDRTVYGDRAKIVSSVR